MNEETLDETMRFSHRVSTGQDRQVQQRLPLPPDVVDEARLERQILRQAFVVTLQDDQSQFC